MAGKKLDKNEEAYLRALLKDDPEGENWTASWRTCTMILSNGGDQVGSTPEGGFSIAKNLYKRKLLDKEPGRASLWNNGYALNAAAKEWLKENTEEEETE